MKKRGGGCHDKKDTDMTTVLEWRTPRDPKKSSGRQTIFTPEIQNALMRRPNEWAVVDSRTYSSPAEKLKLSNSMSARTSQWKKRYQGFEFTTRVEADESRIVVFSRYLG